MKAIDVNQKIIVTITDETKGGMMYEVQMTVGEFFAKFLPDFKPEVVEAVPMAWILNKVGDEENYTLQYRHAWSQLVSLWENEQEAR